MCCFGLVKYVKSCPNCPTSVPPAFHQPAAGLRRDADDARLLAEGERASSALAVHGAVFTFLERFYNLDKATEARGGDRRSPAGG